MSDGHKITSQLKAKGKNLKGINMVLVLLKGILNNILGGDLVGILYKDSANSVL